MTDDTMLAHVGYLVIVPSITHAQRAFMQEIPCECIVSVRLQVRRFMHLHVVTFFLCNISVHIILCQIILSIKLKSESTKGL